MDVREALLALAVCYAADEVSTRAVLKAGGRESMVQRPAVRIALKVSILPLFAKKRKAGWLMVPAAFCAAGAWNGLVVLPEQQRRNVRGGR